MPDYSMYGAPASVTAGKKKASGPIMKPKAPYKPGMLNQWAKPKGPVLPKYVPVKPTPKSKQSGSSSSTVSEYNAQRANRSANSPAYYDKKPKAPKVAGRGTPAPKKSSTAGRSPTTRSTSGGGYSYSGGGGGGGTGGGGGGGGTTDKKKGTTKTATVATATPTAAAADKELTYDEWLKKGGGSKDSVYQAQINDAELGLKTLLADLTQQNSDNLTNYNDSINSLGYKNGQWDTEDRTKAFGGAYQNTQNDFSGRGLLDSSFYSTAQQDLGNRFTEQKSNLDRDKTRNEGVITTNTNNANAARANAEKSALAEAYARYVAKFGGAAV